MTDFNCPYCNTSIELDPDGDAGLGCIEGITFNTECHSCRKTFIFTPTVEISYKAYRADCLNDGQHEWKLKHTYPHPFKQMRCWVCGQEKQLTDEEKDG